MAKRKFLETIDLGDMADDVYQESDGSYYHDVYYKEDDPGENDTGEYYDEWSRAYPDKDL